MSSDPISLQDALEARRSAARGFERPYCFDLTCGDDAAVLEALLATQPDLTVHDTLVSQVAELVHARTPTQKRKAERDAEVLREFLAGRDAHSYGSWVYYPWRQSLVHLLPEAEFRELRSARNQLHVSAREQQSLREKCVGIVGLSVGYSMAVTMALEGVGGRFRLADFDRLELSNTNRVPSGVLALGENKAVLAARAMFEIDPYLEIEVFEAGIHPDNAERFFAHGGKLDLLVEECDDLPMKLRLRELAQRLGVAVITETSQRGLLDLERFDLEPTRAPFHGLMGTISAAELARLSTREKAPFLLRFLQGAEGMSTSLAASLVEVERSLAGWPQLASAVALGGAVVTDAARRLLLGGLCRSGRFQIDLEALVSDQAAATLREAQIEREPSAQPMVLQAPVAPEDALARWVQWATLAPSGGNLQPWRFEELDDGSVLCRLELHGATSALDPDARAARVACGAAYTNLALAAGRDGFRCEPQWEPDPGDPALLFRCRFVRDPGLYADPLSAYVPLRCTNRRVTERSALLPAQVAALRAEAEQAGAGLVLHDSEAALEGIGRVLGELERVRLFSEPFYREMMAELVDAPDAPVGIALDTLALSPADRAALQIMRRRDVVALLRAEQRGQALLELALQPISAGLYMLEQLAGSAIERLPAWERSELTRLRPDFERYFAQPQGRSGILVFRVFQAQPPSARSGRRPLSQVLQRARLGERAAE